MTDPRQALKDALTAARVTYPAQRAAIAAIVQGECDFVLRREESYSGTPNERLRRLFGARLNRYDDARLDALKADDRAFFNAIYGGPWGAYHFGNRLPDDGFDFRGGGFVQLTGRANWERYGGPDLTAHPELIDDPVTGARVAVSYILSRRRGTGFDAMVRAVGNNSPDSIARKSAAYAELLRTGEFS